MKKLLLVISLFAFGALIFSGIASADDENCGAMIEGKWNIKNAGDIKSHVKHQVKIDKQSEGFYSVKIRNQDGDVVYKSDEDFSLSCSGDKAELSGNIKIGHCVHAYMIGYPNEGDNVSVKITTVHDKGECTGHKDTMHEKDRKHHTTVASSKRSGK